MSYVAKVNLIKHHKNLSNVKLANGFHLPTRGVFKLSDIINPCLGSSQENAEGSFFLTKSSLHAVSPNFLSTLL